jgi:hypothetical protein
MERHGEISSENVVGRLGSLRSWPVISEIEISTHRAGANAIRRRNVCLTRQGFVSAGSPSFLCFHSEKVRGWCFEIYVAMHLDA